MNANENHKEDLDLERFSSLVSAFESGDPDTCSLALRALAAMDYMRFLHIARWIYYKHIGIFAIYFGRNCTDRIYFKNMESYSYYIKRVSKNEYDPVYRMIDEITCDDFPVLNPLAKVTKEEEERYGPVLEEIRRITDNDHGKG